MDAPWRSIGFTTTCKVGVDFETMTVLFQSILIGWLCCCADVPQARMKGASSAVRRVVEGRQGRFNWFISVVSVSFQNHCGHYSSNNTNDKYNRDIKFIVLHCETTI